MVLSHGFGARIETDPSLIQRGIEYAHESQRRLAEVLRNIPSDATQLHNPYLGEFNITKGYRPANTVKLDLAAQKTTVSMGLKFDGHTGDDTRPLFWMQYDSLFNAAVSAGFEVNRGTLDSEIGAFKSDENSYFRGNVREAMSAFHPSELELVLSFLWPEGIPKDVQRQMR